MPAPQSAGPAYELVGHDDDDMASPVPQIHKPAVTRRAYWTWLAALVGCVVLCLGFGSFGYHYGLARSKSAATSDSDCPCRLPDVPQYFQTSPQLWAGPTPTGKAPFLAQTVVFDPTATYVPNEPLRTSMPVVGMGTQDENIFKHMGFVYRARYRYHLNPKLTPFSHAVTYPHIRRLLVSAWTSTRYPPVRRSSRFR